MSLADFWLAVIVVHVCLLLLLQLITRKHTFISSIFSIFFPACPPLLHPSFQQDMFLHHIRITSGLSSLNSLWHLLTGWSVRSLHSFGPGTIKAISAFCLWSVVRIAVPSRLWLIISDSKVLHMKSTAVMAAAGSVWGVCYAAHRIYHLCCLWKREI